MTQYTLPDSGWLCQSGFGVPELCYPDPYFRYEEEDDEIEEDDLPTPTDQVRKTMIALLTETFVGEGGTVEIVPVDEDYVPPTPVVAISSRRIANIEVTCIEQNWDFRDPLVICFTDDGIEVARYDTDFKRVATQIRRELSPDEFKLPYPTTTADDPRIVEN